MSRFTLNLRKEVPKEVEEKIKFDADYITLYPFNCPYTDCVKRGKITCAAGWESPNLKKGFKIPYPCPKYKKEVLTSTV